MTGKVRESQLGENNATASTIENRGKGKREAILEQERLVR